jgi:hypothetical protein
MFEKLKLVQKLMTDENARKLLEHPKVQEVLRDTEVQGLIQQENMMALASHPKFSALMQDPELAELIKKVDFGSLLK